MSHTFRKLDVDYIVSIDPGYATQGIFVFQCGQHAPIPILSRSTLTHHTFGIWERIAFQFEHIKAVLNWLQTSNIIITLEEYHAAGKTSHKATYFRAFYDALFRERLMDRFRYAVTIHPMKVRRFSKPAPTVEGKKKIQHPVYDGSVEGTLKYMGYLFPDVFHPSILDAQAEFHQVVSQKGKPPARDSKNSWVGHCTDAGVMGMMGAVSFVYDGFLDRLDGDQRKITEDLRETHTFTTEASRTYR